MSLSESAYDRLTLVSSLYGPGTIVRWLCIVMSVFVTWTLNLRSRHRDSITNDFIAALSMPIFAACHVFYLLSSTTKSSQLSETVYFERQSLLTFATPAVEQYAATVEAPLIICDTFSSLALILFALAALGRLPRRAVGVLLAGLLAFSTETMIFAQTSGIAVVESNLARPFLFNFFDVMVTILVILGLSLLGLIVLAVHSVSRLLARGLLQAARQEQSPGQELQNMTDDEVLQIPPDNEARAEQFRRQIRILDAMTPLLIVMMLLSGIATSSAGTGLLGMTNLMESLNWGERLSFFIPKTSVSITEIDQLAALSGGLFTLAFSLWDAFISRREGLLGQGAENGEMSRRIHVEAERETRSRRILLRRFDELETIQRQLNEGIIGPEEQQNLLSRRQQLQQELASLMGINISPISLARDARSTLVT